MTALDNRHKLKSFIGVTKLYLTHYSCVAIILLGGLYKSLFSTYSFGKLVFCLFAIFVFSACSEFDLILINFCNICTIIIYIVGVRYSVFLFSLIIFQLSNLWEQTHAIKTWLQLLIKNHASRESLSFKNSIYSPVWSLRHTLHAALQPLWNEGKQTAFLLWFSLSSTYK